MSAQTALADQLDFNDLKDEANKVFVALVARTDLPEATRYSLRHQLGSRYAIQQKWPESIAVYEAMLQQNAKDFDAAMTLGTVLTRAGREPDAIALYIKVLAEKSFPPVVHMDAHIRLGGLYEKQNNKPEAIRHYQEALKIDQQNTIATEGLRRLGVKVG